MLKTSFSKLYRNTNFKQLKNPSLNLRKFSTTLERQNFKKLDEADVAHFKSIIPADDVLTSDLEFYNTDWLRKYKGNSSLVLRPKTTEQISKILNYCNIKKLAVVPQGGNTGLVGGSVPVFDEIILSTTKMNKIHSFDTISSTIHCEAGCVLETLNNYVEEKGYTMPLDLGAKGSCQIGGNLATNAGGIHFVKHGSLRKNCKGLKAVLADGTIIDSMNPLPKNNTGYDLKQLFIGSEGTLGIITECLLNIPAKPKFNDLLLVSCEKFEDILNIYKNIKLHLEEVIYAIEFFDNESLLIQEKHGRISPLEQKYPFYLLIETASNNPENQKILEDFISIIEPLDGVIAQDESQKKKMWEIRETIQEGASREGIVLSYDISLPLQHFYEVVEESRKKVGDLAKVIGYGHIGDYNLHLNICYDKFECDENFHKIEKIMEPFIYDTLVKYRGSVSAEHGIGLHKVKYLDRTQNQNSIELMKLIKRTMDPNNILNPYKVIKF
jgi:FAD/FMN-containing dehydrogenase